ncbi:hypothetical protein [Anaeromicrobium sediminis]|uniref:Uncharacterized protein n=1 Tax=Anaeromicrobium sediminis TaxID=1478221 RepID=A0A267ML87_9FIRM|nr:hypothetical protein [Anaeromicrobium sediminis]PAB59540.1 hypothetical protein CCE28_10020 [Anaeromicrobium sediminis]
MDRDYVIYAQNDISSPMSREEAIAKVKEYAHKGVDAYIMSREEGERVKFSNEFNTPEWTNEGGYKKD